MKKQNKVQQSESNDLSVLEKTATAFDPMTAQLDLTKAEKRRTTALMLAIQAYKELIIRDAEVLRHVSDLARRNEGPAVTTATTDAIVIAAVQFDAFIGGEHLVETDAPIAPPEE